MNLCGTLIESLGTDHELLLQIKQILDGSPAPTHQPLAEHLTRALADLVAAGELPVINATTAAQGAQLIEGLEEAEASGAGHAVAMVAPCNPPVGGASICISFGLDANASSVNLAGDDTDNATETQSKPNNSNNQLG